jgi:hypothetical protein
VDNFGDESDLDGENRLDEDEIHDGEFTAYGEAWCTTLRRRQLNVPSKGVAGARCRRFRPNDRLAPWVSAV